VGGADGTTGPFAGVLRWKVPKGPREDHRDVADPGALLGPYSTWLSGAPGGGLFPAFLTGELAFDGKGSVAEALDTAVLLPDSGSRYLSKVFDDDWMRENGFLESAWAGATAADVLATRKLRDLITAQPTDKVSAVIAKMKLHDISQMPVLSAEGSLAGMVTEVDLLNYLVLGDKHTPDQPVVELVRTDVATLGPDAPLESLMSVFVNRQVAVVMDEGRAVSILTKIDILDYLASHSK